MKGKLKEWDFEDHPQQTEEWEDLETSGVELGMGDLADYYPDLDSDLDLEDLDFGPNDYEFISQDGGNAAEEEEEMEMEMEGIEAGPGPQTAANRLRASAAAAHAGYRVLEEDNDERVVVVEKNAGHVHRKEKPPSSKIYDKDSEGAIDMTINSFHPFNSELDWRIAQWAIKEDPGHKAFDRLLSIPGAGRTFCQAVDHSKKMFLGR
jgi:hypothetical protein